MDPGKDMESLVSAASHIQESTGVRKHPVYWFDDGFLVLHVQNTLFRVHLSLLKRHSPYLASLQTSDNPAIKPVPMVNETHTPVMYVVFGPDRPVNCRDVEALLEHMYHDFPLCSDSPFERIAAVLRSSSPLQLNMPAMHAKAKEHFCSMFLARNPSETGPDHLHQALLIARSFDLPSILKVVLYRIMISSNLGSDDGGTSHPPDPEALDPLQVPLQSALVSETHPSENTHQLTEADLRLCQRLMTRVIDHFTPILFTPATTPHMSCTDVFADTWMTLVISPAIADSGVYRPIETLERMKGLDWARHGLCAACVVEKSEEWAEEQEKVWALVEKWTEEESIG